MPTESYLACSTFMINTIVIVHYMIQLQISLQHINSLSIHRGYEEEGMANCMVKHIWKSLKMSCWNSSKLDVLIILRKWIQLKWGSIWSTYSHISSRYQVKWKSRSLSTPNHRNLNIKIRASKNPNERRGRKQKGVRSIWTRALEVVMEANPNGKTEDVYNAFIVSLGEAVSKHPTDLPRTEDGGINNKAIKSAMYQLRSKSKKNAKKSLI